MNPDQHDMLIRIDERTLTTKEDVELIKKTLKDLPCATQTEKVKTLEKITWGALLLALSANIKAYASIIFK